MHAPSSKAATTTAVHKAPLPAMEDVHAPAAWAVLVHLWLPSLSVLGLALALVQTLPAASIFSPGLCALMTGVLLVYTADRLLEPGRIARPMRAFLWVVAAVAAGFCAWCALRLPARLLAVQALLGISAGLYVWLKRYALVKTTLIAATWWLACSLMPIQLPQASIPCAVLVSKQALSLALMVAAGAIMCDYKDEFSDRAARVLSLPLYLGHARTVALTSALALLAMALAWWAQAWALVATAALIALLGSFPRLLARPLLGPTLVDGALALAGVFAWLVDT